MRRRGARAPEDFDRCCGQDVRLLWQGVLLLAPLSGGAT